MKDLLIQKWGSSGTTYNLYDRGKPNSDERDNEGYRYVRLIDGVPKIYQPAWGNAGG